MRVDERLFSACAEGELTARVSVAVSTREGDKLVGGRRAAASASNRDLRTLRIELLESIVSHPPS